MQIVHTLAELDSYASLSVVTIGNFDGVHCGHRMVIASMLERARNLSARAVAVTFNPHPAHLLHPESRLPLITPMAEKLELLSATGLDLVLVLPFTEELRRWTARQFAERVLRETLHTVEVHEGETFRFGYHAEAGITSLSQLGREMGFAVRAYEPRISRGAAISSSRIRGLIGRGDLHQARALLGRSFSIRSTPAPGRGYGTLYTVPTINLAPYPELLPEQGVYITTMKIGGGMGAGLATRVFRGVTNIGNRPTFGPDSFAVETHLLDFEPVALDGETPLELTFLRRLRPELRFDSSDALRAQIALDVKKAQHYFDLADTLKARVG